MYVDILAPGHQEAYSRLLDDIREAGYQVHSVVTFWEQVKQGTLNSQTRYLVLRHDVDSDAKAARVMWELEQRHGIQSSYYFRLSTIDISLMKAISQAGGEASYHYEEVATVAKKHRLKTREQVYSAMNSMKELFSRNLADLRTRTGLPIITVASHGDFANRKTGVFNWELLLDEMFRKENNVELEAYDKAFLSHVGSRHTDSRLPPYWTTEHPVKALERGEHVTLILIHPNNWYVHKGRTFLADAKRVCEGVRFSL